MDLNGPLSRISSALNSELNASARALSYESPVEPTEATAPTSGKVPGSGVTVFEVVGGACTGQVFRVGITSALALVVEGCAGAGWSSGPTAPGRGSGGLRPIHLSARPARPLGAGSQLPGWGRCLPCPCGAGSPCSAARQVVRPDLAPESLREASESEDVLL